MLTGQELGKAIASALQIKGRGAQADLARALDIKPPSVSELKNTGRIDKSKLPSLWRFFSDIVGPEHWGIEQYPWAESGKETNFKEGPELNARCPLISWVQAGEMCDAYDPFPPGVADEWYQCPVKHGPFTYVLEVIGESMDTGDAHGYREGEHIYVDPEQQPKHGDDVIVRTPDGKATFKRLQVTPDGNYLLALNPNWPNRIIKVEEGTVICGKIIYSGKPRG
jgi:SOS-response transcriptional repressor LexA